MVAHRITVSSTENNRTFTFVFIIFPPDFLRNIFCFVREKAIDQVERGADAAKSMDHFLTLYGKDDLASGNHISSAE